MKSLAGLTPEAAFDFLVFIVALILVLALLLWTFRVLRGWLTRASLTVPERRALQGHMKSLGNLALFCTAGIGVSYLADPHGPLLRVLSPEGAVLFAVATVPFFAVLRLAARRVDREIS